MEKKINKDKNNPIKQHHVPKVYLKNFCEQKGQLAVLNKQTGKIFSASIDSVGFEKNFYTLSKWKIHIAGKKYMQEVLSL